MRKKLDKTLHLLIFVPLCQFLSQTCVGDEKALVFYRGFLFIKIETIKPTPTITSITFQNSLPKAILKNGIIYLKMYYPRLIKSINILVLI